MGEINDKSSTFPKTAASEETLKGSQNMENLGADSKVLDKFSPIRKGFLELAVLQVIATKKVYAADILETLNKTEFTTQEGTLYPLLSKLRQEGAVDYEWVESEAGPPRKYYRLTEKGREQLGQLKKYWQKINTTINALGDSD